MSSRLRFRIDAELSNADWPKRTDDKISGMPTPTKKVELETIEPLTAPEDVPPTE